MISKVSFEGCGRPFKIGVRTTEDQLIRIQRNREVTNGEELVP